MKILNLVVLLVLFSCQNKASDEGKPVEKVVTRAEEDLSIDKQNFVFVPDVEGMRIGGEKISRKGDILVGENISVIESSSDKIIDEYSVLDWGPVGFKTEGKILKVFPVQDVLELNYELVSNKIKKTSNCHFSKKPDPALFKEQQPRIQDPKTDLDSVLVYLFKLATMGDKASYDFFISPDKEAMKVLKSPTGKESSGSMIKVLTFMKNHGCRW